MCSDSRLGGYPRVPDTLNLADGSGPVPTTAEALARLDETMVEAMMTQRAIRRLRPDPVDDRLLEDMLRGINAAVVGLFVAIEQVQALQHPHLVFELLDLVVHLLQGARCLQHILRHIGRIVHHHALRQ